MTLTLTACAAHADHMLPWSFVYCSMMDVAMMSVESSSSIEEEYAISSDTQSMSDGEGEESLPEVNSYLAAGLFGLVLPSKPME